MSKLGNTPGSWRVRHDRIPPELVKFLYVKALELTSQGLGPVDVARKLSGAHSLSVAPGTVRHWMVGDRKPGIRNVFKEEPSPALSYIIGATKGDGCAMIKSGFAKLEVADRDFEHAYNANMATLFSRTKPNKILVRRRADRLPMYIVKYSSRQLVQFLQQPLNSLHELASAFPLDFLRGFFDAEGHVDVSITEYLGLAVGAENSDKQLLSKVRKLLEEVKITSRIQRKRRKGTIRMIRGKTFVMRRTSYSIAIGKLADVKRFADMIGFSINRKKQKLRDALSIIVAHESRDRPAIWRQLYSKKGGEWVRRNLTRRESNSLKQDPKGPSHRGR